METENVYVFHGLTEREYPPVQFERVPDERLLYDVLDDFPTSRLSDWEDERNSRPFPY
jgi:hypothetical protein